MQCLDDKSLHILGAFLLGRGKAVEAFNRHLPPKSVNFARFLLLVFLSSRYELVKSASPFKFKLWVGRPTHSLKKTEKYHETDEESYRERSCCWLD